MSEAQELETARKRIIAALKTSDWQQFRQYCCPNIAIEEYWQLYKDYLAKGAQEKAYSGTLFPKGQGKQDAAIVLGIKISVNKRLTKEESTAFTQFCELVKSTAKSGRGEGYVEAESDDDEYHALCGTAITGTLVSNMSWWIQLENYRGQWKVRRLVLTGH